MFSMSVLVRENGTKSSHHFNAALSAYYQTFLLSFANIVSLHQQ
jgi:hypothetical protein